MKNKHEVLGLVINIVLVLLLFCFIVAGLNIIGIYSLPEPVERLLGTYDGEDSHIDEDDSVVYNTLNFDENAASFESVVLDYNNAHSVLESLYPASEYSQNAVVTYYFNDKIRKEQLDIQRDGDIYKVSVFDDRGAPVKTVEENGNIVTISEYADDELVQILVEKGNFDISEECGFVLTAQEFINSGYSLSEGDFSQITRDDGIFLSVSFIDQYEGVNQRMNYIISLDFGVVFEARCYENDVLVYEMTTLSLARGE